MIPPSSLLPPSALIPPSPLFPAPPLLPASALLPAPPVPSALSPAALALQAGGFGASDRVVVPALLALALAAIHLVPGRVTILGRISRSLGLSFAGGVSVAYVFVHVLPEIDDFRGRLDDAMAIPLVTEREIYIVVLAGFVTYYGLERLATRSADETDDGEPSPGVFWVHVGSYGTYNAIVGYLLFHRRAPGVGSLVLFAVAFGLHFLLNDVSLCASHGDAYRDRGRWVLAAAVLLGAVVGALTAVDEAYLGLLFAFLAGGIILSVVREELPAERTGKFWAFSAGAVVYTVILLLP